MFTMFAPVIGTIVRLPKAIKVGAVIYAAGAVVSATKSVIKGDSAGTVAKRAAKSWFGMSRTAPMTRKHKKAVKKAADTLTKNPTKANLNKALATAKEAGVPIPASVVTAVEKL